MIPSLECELFTGGELSAQILAPVFWDALGDSGRRAILWDRPEDKKPAAFLNIIRQSCVTCLVWLDRTPAAICWLNPVMSGAKCAAIHFSFARHARPHALALGKHFLRKAQNLAFASLLAMLPFPYRGARSYAASLGFKSMGILPGACHLAASGRTCAAELYRYTWS